MENLLIVGQAFLQVIKIFWLVIPLSIVGIYAVNKLDKEENEVKESGEI